MGASIAMIDCYHGQLATDNREHGALALERGVDAAWTSSRMPRKPIRKTVYGLSNASAQRVEPFSVVRGSLGEGDGSSRR